MEEFLLACCQSIYSVCFLEKQGHEVLILMAKLDKNFFIFFFTRLKSVGFIFLLLFRSGNLFIQEDSESEKIQKSLLIYCPDRSSLQ